jgi:hypothetical protein
MDLRKKAERKAYVARKKNARSENAKWRSLPATEEQWKVLRMIGRRTRVEFDVDITRGEASEVIAARFKSDPQACRAHRAAQRRRDEAA